MSIKKLASTVVLAFILVSSAAFLTLQVMDIWRNPRPGTPVPDTRQSTVRLHNSVYSNGDPAGHMEIQNNSGLCFTSEHGDFICVLIMDGDPEAASQIPTIVKPDGIIAAGWGSSSILCDVPADPNPISVIFGGENIYATARPCDEDNARHE